MRQIELYTQAGEYVATVEILPYTDGGMPKVVLWGARTFMRESDLHYSEVFATVSLTPSPGLPRRGT